MDDIDQRETLARLARDRGVGYAALSRLIGRNAAYVQQFVKRGVPKKLEEDDRHTLARFFGVADSALGGPSREAERVQAGSASGAGERNERPSPSGLVLIPRLNIEASAGSGAIPGDESAWAHVGFEERWLRRRFGGRPADLSLISVKGDSMAPTLLDGDDILVNAADAAARLREGIYVLRRDDALQVKRISPNPASRRILIKSDNPNYPSWPNCRPGDIDVIGRVVWGAHCFG